MKNPDGSVTLTVREANLITLWLGMATAHIPIGTNVVLTLEQYTEAFEALGIENPMQYWRFDSNV